MNDYIVNKSPASSPQNPLGTSNRWGSFSWKSSLVPFFVCYKNKQYLVFTCLRLTVEIFSLKTNLDACKR
jgi:hypothetical protein